ncbi:hypothetical protein QOZ80_9AG0670710 [Eleusine coracana subsp. coracana]|nr:hypothetical protein QOZ80_9AG0670710 [Eleusine coracana subsp. coracana]
MKRLLRNSKRFEYHASPRMIPHLCKPEVKYVQFTIKKYIPSLKKIRVAIKGSPPNLKMSEEDGQLIARYFGMDKDVWRPSLEAFPRFQLSPSVVHKVMHSFRTTDMLTDAMQQLQDLSFFRTKCGSPLQESVDAALVTGQACDGTGLDAVGNREAMPQGCDSVKDSSKEVLNQSVYMPSSQFKTYPIHTFFSGDHVTVDSGGNVSVTFVPVPPHGFVFCKDIKNSDWFHRVPKMARPYKLAAEVSSPTVEFDCPRYVTDSHCSARIASSSFIGQDDVELSPRLTHYIEEGIVPDSPLHDVSDLQVELDGVANDGFVPKIGSLTPLDTTSRRGSMSVRCEYMSEAEISGSIQQAPKYRRLCKYGDKIKRVSISLDACHDGFRDSTTIPNQMEHTTGNKGKGKRRLDTYIDEEVEVSQDADVSEDEDYYLSEDRYEDSFIDDQETPTGKLTQTTQGDGNNGDMMGFYRQSLLTQTPVVLPSRYLDVSDNSASSTTKNASTSETGHNCFERVETPNGPLLNSGVLFG